MSASALNLTEDRLPALMRRIAVPAATGMFLQTVLNITDTWFAGRVSTEGQAALALSFPVFFILNTFGAGLATGASALVGRALGAGDFEAARRMAGQATGLAAVIGFVLSLAAPLMNPIIFGTLGASGDYLSMCVSYMDTFFIFAMPLMLLQAASAFLNTQGDSRAMRNGLMAAVFLNAVMDYWFLYGGLGVPAMGLAGLALATGLVHLGAAIFLWYKVMKTRLFRGGFKSALKPDIKLQRELLTQAGPAALNTASVGLGIYIISWFVAHFGPATVAGYGVAMRLEQVVLLPILGLSMAVLPLTAQNAGAGLDARVLETRRLAIRVSAWLSVAAFVLLFLGGEFFMGLVSRDPAAIAAGALYLKFDGSIFFAYALLTINVAYLQGLKLPMDVLVVGLYRQIAAPLIVFWLLAFTFGLEALGVWLGLVLVNVSGMVLSEFFVKRVRTKSQTPREDAA